MLLEHTAALAQLPLTVSVPPWDSTGDLEFAFASVNTVVTCRRDCSIASEPLSVQLVSVGRGGALYAIDSDSESSLL